MKRDEAWFAEYNAKATRWQRGGQVVDTTSGGVDGHAVGKPQQSIGSSLERSRMDSQPLGAATAGIKPGPLTLILPWPPTGNHGTKHTRSGGHYLTEEHKRFRSAVKSVALQVKARAVHSPYRADVIWFPPDRRRRDSDNVKKTLFDALVLAGVIADDSMRDQPQYTENVVPANQPREGYVQVTLREIA